MTLKRSNPSRVLAFLETFCVLLLYKFFVQAPVDGMMEGIWTNNGKLEGVIVNNETSGFSTKTPFRMV